MIATNVLVKLAVPSVPGEKSRIKFKDTRFQSFKDSKSRGSQSLIGFQTSRFALTKTPFGDDQTSMTITVKMTISARISAVSPGNLDVLYPKG